MNKITLIKLKQFISKYDTYILFAFLLICTIGPIMFIKLVESDEIWNFHNIQKIYNGFEIYKEANIIITPLFFNIGVLFCNLFGLSLLTFKLYNLFLISTLIVLIYKFFINLKISKLKSLIYSLIIYIPTIYIGTGGANYNILVSIFFLIGLQISINESKFKSKALTLLQSIIIFLIFLTKHNVTLYYILGLTMSEVFLCKSSYKILLKSIITKVAIAIIFIISYLIILYFNGSLYDFINYTVLGIPEFSNNFFVEIDAIVSIGIMCIIVLVSLMTLFYKNNSINISDEMKSNIVKLMTFGVCMEFMAYPIVNLYHSITGAYIIFILGFYLFDIIFAGYLDKFKKYLKILVSLILIALIIYSGYNLISYFSFIISDKSEKIEIYEYTIVTKELKEKITYINNYIKYKESLGINVVIFSGHAGVYMLPLGKSNGSMDLPFLGNMGKNGEEEMIKKLDSLKNTEILIVRDEDKLFWQESRIIRKHIIENYKFTRTNRRF
ncbi:MAG: hypothetical protein K0R72_614 [Clostridia bacterium]|jgi:hypothetical protein|nr:hypothetical protein [Clostridia bacterium]